VSEMPYFSITFQNYILIRDAAMTGLHMLICAVILDTILVIRTLLKVSEISCLMTAQIVNVIIIVVVNRVQRWHVFRTPITCTMVFL